MSVSPNLLCSFELLKPLDSSALKSHIKKGRNQRNSVINSPVSTNAEDTATSLIPSSLHKFLHRVSSQIVGTCRFDLYCFEPGILSQASSRYCQPPISIAESV